MALGVSSLIGSHRRVGYEAVANEYYNTLAHPTCSSLREASAIALSPWILGAEASNVIEVGGGKSIVADLITAEKSYATLTISDASESMLDHSRNLTGAALVVAQADALPFDDASFDMLVASLGDPYNGPPFWAEARRVIRSGGYVLFTTPSFEWISCYRGSLGLPNHEAEFVTRSGDVVSLPSRVIPIDEQLQEIHAAGLNGVEIREVSLSELHEPVAAKLRILDGSTNSILTGFRVRVP